jgi:hypothetical protein
MLLLFSLWHSSGGGATYGRAAPYQQVSPTKASFRDRRPHSWRPHFTKLMPDMSASATR